MKKIWLADNVFSSNEKENGHNYKYCKALEKIEGVCIYEKKQSFSYGIYRYPLACRERLHYLEPILTETNVHMLVLDFFYKYPHVFKKLYEDGIQLIGTLHRYPGRKMDEFLLRRTAVYFRTIVVHSDYMKRQLKEIGITNVDAVEYPSFFPSDIKTAERKADDRFHVLALGGTRFEKGADLAVKAMCLLPDRLKSTISLKIAGEELDIRYDELEASAKRERVLLSTEKGTLSERRYWQNLFDADAVICPYRRSFRGMSGPMTDAVFIGKRVIGPDNGCLKEWITGYRCGSCFKSEDVNSLSKAIAEEFQFHGNKNGQSELFPESLSVDTFINRYRKIYENYYN